jgi:hypothetical protein
VSSAARCGDHGWPGQWRSSSPPGAAIADWLRTQARLLGQYASMLGLLIGFLIILVRPAIISSAAGEALSPSDSRDPRRHLLFVGLLAAAC